MLPARGRDGQKRCPVDPHWKDHPRTLRKRSTPLTPNPPGRRVTPWRRVTLGEGAPHGHPTYLEKGALMAPLLWKKEPCGNLQSAQEKGHSHGPPALLEEGAPHGHPGYPGEGAPHGLPQPICQKEHPGDSQPALDKGHLLFSLATGHGHPKNFPLQAPEAPHAPQALSTAPRSLSYLY